MKVKVTWTETAQYEAVIEVPVSVASALTGEAVSDALDEGLMLETVRRDPSCVAIDNREIDEWKPVSESVIPSAPKHEEEW